VCIAVHSHTVVTVVVEVLVIDVRAVIVVEEAS
jgi:hypothetical protein